MAYCTLTELKLYLPEADIIELTDDAGAGVVNTNVTDEAIASADELIDGYTRGRYTVPFAAPVPGIVGRLSCRLAAFNLYDRKVALKIPDRLLEGHKEDLALLEKIRKGEVLLDAALAAAGASSGDYETNCTADSKIFTDEWLNTALV